jgi:D-beta-D-heptose 7-phosphate kinase / D-beta-D-heptose 1-phosphate adenosyltransferase
MNKIITLEEAKEIKQNNEGKSLVLMTGCFDVIHFGHIDYFRFAKKQGDILIVGIENDQNIKINKGDHRPIFNFLQRAKVLSELESIDYIFENKKVVSFDSDKADKVFLDIMMAIKPDILISHSLKDETKKRKGLLCQKADIELRIDESDKTTSSTEIIDHVKEYFKN